MKRFLVIISGLALCSCADMHIVKTDVAGSVAAPIDTKDAKDFGSRVHVVTNCGVGAHDPVAIYIRPFCVDQAVVQGDIATSEGEMPIRKALIPVEFATDLKEQMEKMAPTRVLRDNERPRVGWLVEGSFNLIDGGSKLGRFFAGQFGVGRSFLSMHVRITDVRSDTVVYEFDVAGGSRLQGKLGTVRASGLGKATDFDLKNAAERIYLALTADPFRFGARSDVSLR